MTVPALRSRHRRAPAALALLLACAIAPGPAPSGAAGAPGSAVHSSAPADAIAIPGAAASQLVVLSTTDVKGKSSPCGCHTPKGGLARRAAYADSVRASNSNLLVVDSGGFFPEEDDYESAAVFMLEAMKALPVDAAGLGETDLRFGRAFLLAALARTKVPVTCANVFERSSGRALVAPLLLRSVGRAKVGVFGLLSEHANLGPSRDSLRVTDPLPAAERAVAALRAKGATVIVCLAELGKVESEEVANVIEGIDLVIAGRNMPLIPVGRRIRNAVMVYGGEQSHFIGQTTLSLDAAGRVGSGDAEMVMLGPDVPEQPAMFAMVRKFEDGFNEELKRREKERALHAVAGEGSADEDEPREHYVGADVCARCHRTEYEQWRSTPHARAWATLVDKKVDGRTDCVPCHVVGWRKPGGYQGDFDLRLVNVQCEMCHGMGTAHDSGAPVAKITELTCRKCHDETSSPAFTFETYQPHILHHSPAVLPPLPPKPATAMH